MDVEGVMKRDTERGWRGEEDAEGGMWSLRDSIQCRCDAGCSWNTKRKERNVSDYM